MRIWPGHPSPLGATFDGIGTNFSLFSELADRVELCLFDDDGRETRVDLPETTALCWHGYLPDVQPGPALRLPGARAVGARSRASAAIPPSCCSIRTPRRSTAPWTGTRRSFRITSTSPRRSTQRPRQRAVHAQDRSSSTRTSTGATTAGRNTPWHETVVYETHVKGFTQRHPDIPEELRGTYAGLAHPAVDRATCSSSASPRSSCCRCTSSCTTDAASSAACATTGATTRSATSRRTTSTPASGQRGEQVQEFKQMVKTLHEAGIEVILDVVYNHTAEGNHLGPMLSFKGIDNAAYYRLDARQPPLLHGLHRHRQHAEHAAPARAAADHGQPALLGARDARRRLPLRPRGDARPRAARGRPAVGVLRPRSSRTRSSAR